MFKLLAVGDVHSSESTPLARIDDYQLTQDNKAEEIQKIAKENGCPLILQTGDFLDKPRISEPYLQKILKRWGHVKASDIIIDNINKKRKKLSGIPLVGVVGNHEIYGSSYKSFSKTSLSVLEEAGLIKMVGEKPLIIKDGDKTIAITGSNYSYDVDKEPYDAYVVKEKLGDIHIHIVHGMGVNEDLPDFMQCTNIRKFADKTKADLTLIGHYHKGFGPIEIDGKWFVNPGALMRITSSKDDLEREVHVALISIDKKIEIEMIPLKSALNSDLVLSRQHIDDKKDKELFSKDIKKTIEDVKFSSNTTVKDIIDDIAKNQNIDNNVKDELLERFNIRMANIKPLPIPPKYKIVKLKLENFQSHKETEIEFGDFNVFTGTSGSGKTSILRAFSWIIEDKVTKNPRSMIYANEKYMSAEITLDNGMKIKRYIDRKKNGFNGYFVDYNDGSPVAKMNTGALPQIQELLGFHYLTISEDQTKQPIDLNFLKQSAGWFFIGDGTTSPDRAKIIGSIYKTHIADAVQKELDLNLKRINTLIKSKEENIHNIELEIEGMIHVEKMEKIISVVEPLAVELNRLKEKLNIVKEYEVRLKKLQNKEEAIKSTIKELSDAIAKKEIVINYEKNLNNFYKIESIIKNKNKIETIKDIKEKFETLLEKSYILNDLKVLQENYCEAEKLRGKFLYSKKYVTYTKTILEKLNSLLENKELVEKAKILLDKKNEIVKSEYSIKKTKIQIKTCANVIEDLNSKVALFKTLNNEYLELNDKINYINNSKIDKMHSAILQTKKELNDEQKVLNLELESYNAIINSLDVCPTCYRELNDEDKMKMLSCHLEK